jgi:CBS domain-containing protein
MRIIGAVKKLGGEPERFASAIEVEVVSTPSMTGRKWMETAVVACPRLHAIDGGACLACDRLINVKPAPDRASAVLRCMVSDGDPVRDYMIPAIGLAAVDPATELDVARRCARQWGVHHLMVVSGEDVLEGIVCGCRLRPPAGGDRVGDRMTVELAAVDESTTLGEAAAIMRDTGGCLLPVVCGDLVTGLVARGDLTRLGAELDHQPCGGCGGSY